jgi:uncharacterized protein YndB with AHSA1/START domain
MTMTNAIETELKVTLTQHVNASPQRVFEAWLDPQLLCKWIGPRAWVEWCETAVLEPRVGGRYQLRSHTRPRPGHDPCSGVSGVYRQIDRHTRLSFTWLRDGEDVETLVTVLFEPDGAGTLLTLTHEGFASDYVRKQHLAGWAGSLTQLADLLELRLTLTQQVNAPPQRVFDALLDPKLVCRWMGPRTMVEACEIMTLEPRVGGRYRFKMVRRADSPNGPGTIFVTGTYQEIYPPNRLVYSWMWEDQGHESRVTYELKSHAGGTEVTLIHEGFASVDSQQGHQRGWTASLQQLASVLETGASE